MLEQIGISSEVKKEEIKELLSSIFKDCKIHYFDQESSGDIEDKDKLDDASICFTIFKNNSEFPFRVEINRTPERDSDKREQYLAKIFSERLKCRTITNYAKRNSSDPYYSIIFENGLAYLADDVNTIWGDGEGGEVKVIEKIEPHVYSFDGKGNLM